MKKYTVDIIINVSHSISEIDSHTSNHYQIINENVPCKKYSLTEIYQDDTPEKTIEVEFIQKAQIASVAMSKNERNPTDGCPYLVIDWKSLITEQIVETNDSNDNKDNNFLFNDYMPMREYFKMGIIRSININELIEFIDRKGNYTFDVGNFYNGLMANNNESKFFNFYLIIERIEKSGEYKVLFDGDFLFSEDEKNDIKSFISEYEEAKRNSILNTLNKTRLNRAEKLFAYLEKMNLECLNTTLITIDDIKNIINQRNSLFHTSHKLDFNILYNKLFPLVREIVIKQIMKQ